MKSTKICLPSEIIERLDKLAARVRVVRALVAAAPDFRVVTMLGVFDAPFAPPRPVHRYTIE
jgi:hypothetical protein